MEGKSLRPSLGAVSKVTLPFYEPPSRKTSADIINEARAAIQDSQFSENSFQSVSLKPLQTQRPFTPREKERILFGRKTKSNRPPSSFSLRYLQTEADLYTSPKTNDSNSKTTASLTSVLNYGNNKSAHISKKKHLVKTQRSNSISNLGEERIFNAVAANKIKLPALDLLKPIQKKKLYKNTYSLDNSHPRRLVPEEYEETNVHADLDSRKAFSSPQERTDFNENLNENSPFGRPSQKQNNLSRCLLLGPQNLNLNKLFDNRQIVEHSESLFAKSDKSSKPKERSVENILELLGSKHLKDDTDIVNLLNDLYNCMEKENFLNNVNSKMKIRILKCLYKHVESQNEKLLLRIARIILALKVTGNNLSGVCKLIFKVSKSDKNDHLFEEKNILDLFVDSLGRSSPLDDGEACVYGYGSVKFLTMNQNLVKEILELGILPLMVLHIKIINNAKQEKMRVPEHTEHALFQLTGALRNLASDEHIYQEFVSTETVFQLCQTMDLFSSNLDVIGNIARTFSTLSTNDECSDKISRYKNIYKVFVKLFEKYPGNEEIIVRLAYTVGNILAKSNDSRIKFYQEEHSIESLIRLWKIYLERTLKNCSLKMDEECVNGSNSEDVMIKIIRIIANMAINADIGKTMTEKYGMELLNEFLKVLISNPFKKNDELTLSVLSTLNNLSYYYSTDFERDVFHIKQLDIMEAITEYITSKNEDCMIEAIRVLGNLSRSRITRNYVTERNIFTNLVNILDKDDLNLLKTTIGVFVNLMADNKNRVSFKNSGGISKLINILNTHGQCDWTLSMLGCQVLWNICIDALNLYELINDSEMQQLLVVLANSLDEERLFGITDVDEDLEIYLTPEYVIWEEFANVATNLLEKIENFFDSLEQIELEDSHSETVIIPKTKDSSTNINFSVW